jgi:hypothetical protein
LRKSIFAAVPLAVLVLAAPASAHGGNATTYKAKLVAVEAAPAGATASSAGVRGQAKLVDGKRRDKVQLHVKGLTAGESYTWSVRSASGDADACTGEAVDAFEYGTLTARRHGNSGARARSDSFAAEDGASYAVVLTSADGTDVACGEFKTKSQRKAERRAAKKAHGKGRHEASGDDEQGSDDKQSSDDEQSDDGEDAGGDDPAGDD